MSQSVPSLSRPRRSARRWHIPPPLVHGSEPLEGGALLEEIPGAVGVVLWQALRDVLLWAQTPREHRERLFAPGAEARQVAAALSVGVEPGVEVQLRVLAAALADPGSAGERVEVACRALSQWAEAEGWSATALAFAQAAALTSPGDAVAALHVGRLARERADHPRAEVWYRRTVGLARQARDWRTYTHAFIGLGNLYVRRGNFPAARRLRIRALRGARRGGIRQLQGVVLHDLFVLEAESGNVAAAESFARRAFECYGPRSERLPALANDVANFWLINGCFARALRILEPLADLVTLPRERMFVLAGVARAAGGIGSRARFEEAFDRVCRMAADPALRPWAARAYLDLACGASSLGEWERAETAARNALALARERKEAKITFAVEALLESVRHQQDLAAAPAPAAPDTLESEHFASRFEECLHQRATATAG